MKNLTKVLIIGGMMFSLSLPVSAANVEYQNKFNSEPVLIAVDENNDFQIVNSENQNVLFSSERVDEEVYTTANLNIRNIPSIDSERIMVLKSNTEVHRIGISGEYGWDIIEIDGKQYFAWNEYLSTEQDYIDLSIEDNVVEYVYEYTNSAKEIIAQRESGGDYNAISPTGEYIGRYQLTYTMLNGDYSAENQERVAEQYVAERYGSWDAALAFWDANGWY